MNVLKALIGVRPMQLAPTPQEVTPALANLDTQVMVSLAQVCKSIKGVRSSLLKVFIYNYISDINECLTNNGSCQHNCHNSDGSYTCSCNDGYLLNSDGHTCEGRQGSMSRNLMRCMYSTPVQLWVMKY